MAGPPFYDRLDNSGRMTWRPLRIGITCYPTYDDSYARMRANGVDRYDFDRLQDGSALPGKDRHLPPNQGHTLL